MGEGAPVSVLIDISHPAHVHFFRPLARALIAAGAPVTIVGRDKDVTVRLLEASGLPHLVLPMGRYSKGRCAAAGELIRRSRELRRLIRQHSVKVVLTRNPSGVIAAFGTRATSVFDTDDGRSVGIHYWAARPFANIITSSAFDPEVHGRGHRRYRALKAHMFLHPDRFTPDPEVRRRYLTDDEQFCVARFSAHDASHDRRIVGITAAGRRAILERLLRFGPVLVSVEGNDLRLCRDDGEVIPVAPEDFHDLLAAASLFVGDSQSVAAEAAILGVPALRLSGFTGRVFYLSLLEESELVRNFRPGCESQLLAELDDTLAGLALRTEASRRAAERLNLNVQDPAAWFYRLVLDRLGLGPHVEGPLADSERGK